MDQQSDTPNDNPFKPEEEASFNESAAESTVASAPAEVTTEPVATPSPFAAQPSPFEAPADPVNETPLPPATTAADTTPVAEVKKKSKKWIPLAIAGGALVFLGGSASAYYFAVYQNPDNVLYDAYSHIASAKAMQGKGTLTFDMPAMSGIKLKSIEYSGNFENNPSGAMDMTARMTLMSADVSVGGKGKVLDNGDMYFQLTGLVDAFKLYVQASGTSAAEVPEGFYTALGKLQDQWVKVSADDLKKANEGSDKTYQCILDAYKKHKDDSAKPVLDAYKKHAFMTKKEDLGTKDGRIGYKLAFDTTKAKEFADSIKDTDLAKDLSACDSSVQTEDVTSAMDSSSAGDITTNVWIDQWSHELKRVEYSGAVGDSSSKVAFNGNVDMSYDQNVKTTAPSDSISLDEFGQRVQSLMSELGMGGSIEDSISSTL